ncbi:MerR family transcriptional regulator [Frigoribacterium sp. 2-23]|uniref:MerR family transcriptional regulator n=1 Tax=Frigoribacterium sp. 2-23 TaxID=3415006 RepID=UPI003C6EAAB3
MRISQLAETTGVPVATIKYYLREGLVPEGERTNATQARYGEEHVQRLRLIRALLTAGGLSIAAARDVLRHLEAPHDSVGEVLSVAQASVTPAAPEGIDLSRARAVVDGLGWQIDPDAVDALASLEAAIDGLEAAGFELPEGALDGYAEAMATVAQAEIDGIPADSVEAAVHYVVLGTVLVEPLLLALRRLAQQDASWRRFGG